MTTQLSPLPIQRFYDNNNFPLSGGQLYTYIAGTTTPQATYTDSTGVTPNANPVIMNARGEANVWLAPGQAYKFVLKDASFNTIWTVDQVTSAPSSWVGFKDYGATGTGVETTQIQAALTGSQVINQPGLTTYTTGALSSSGNIINWPGGSYTSNAAIPDPLVLSNLTDAPALTFTNASGHAYSRSFGNLTANAIYNAVFPSVSSFDVGSNVLHMVAGTTVVNNTATAGYFKNDAAASGGNGNAVALFGCGQVTANNGAGWGVNTLLMDSATRVAGSGTGRFLIGAELDFNVMNPGTQVIGVSVGGNSLSQPTVANGFIVNTLGNGNKWQTGFWSMDGAASTALAIGSTATSGSNVASQQIQMVQRDNSGTKQVVSVVANPGGASAPTTGFLVIGGSTAVSLSITLGDIFLSSGRNITINAQPVLGGRISGYGTPTNVFKMSSFPGTAATLSQTAGLLAALIVDLEAHGMIGT